MLLIQIVVRTYDPKTMLDINVELNVTVQCPPQVEKQCTDTGGTCDMSRKFKKTKFQVEEALKSVKKLQNEVEKKCDNEGGPRWRRSRGWSRGWQFLIQSRAPQSQLKSNYHTWMTTETFVIYLIYLLSFNDLLIWLLFKFIKFMIWIGSNKHHFAAPYI